MVTGWFFANSCNRRHATLKGVIEAVPIELKSDRHVDAFGFCLYVALLASEAEGEIDGPLKGCYRRWRTRNVVRVGSVRRLTQERCPGPW
jgi:hypothetical protein